MSDSVRPHRWQPTRLPHPRDSPGKNTGVGCHLLLQCMKVKSESEVAQSCPTLATPRTAVYQAPPSMGLSRQKYWSGVPLSYDQPKWHIKRQRHYFANKGPSSQSYGFSSSHVWMWKLDCEESWALRNWCLCTAMLEKTVESPLDCKEIKPVHP